MVVRKKYDVSMIRDFLDHLTIELRVNIENVCSEANVTSDTMTVDAELVSELTQWTGKYDASLLPRLEIDSDGASDEQCREARQRLNEELEKKRSAQLEHLEQLQELFAEALECAGQSEKWPSKSVPIKSLLDSDAES